MGLTDEAKARSRRAEARRGSLVGRIVQAADDSPPVGRTVQERLEMLADASRRAWALSKRATPIYRRGDIPGRVVRAPEK